MMMNKDNEIRAGHHGLWIFLLVVLLAAGFGERVWSDADDDHAEPVAGKHHEHDGKDGHEGDGEHQEDGAIHIEPGVQQRFGITVVPAGSGQIEVVAELPGEVVVDPGRISHVRPSLPGTIRRVYRHVGDKVRAGEVLAEIESTETLAVYAIRSGIAGVVVAEHAPPGEVVDMDRELFTVADTSQVWVHLFVFPSDLERIRIGQQVEVLRPGAGSGSRGRISFVSPLLDHEMRTSTARIILKNEDHLQPGLFVTGRVVLDHRNADVVVPTESLVRDGDDWVVYVQESEERFVERPVEIGARGLDLVEILSGLEAGEPVVRDGAFLVRSAAARGAMGGGHSH